LALSARTRSFFNLSSSLRRATRVLAFSLTLMP
jgi:hypothetical protein